MEIRSTPLISGDFTHDVRRLRKCQRPLTSQIAGWKEYESQRHVALNWARRLKRVFGIEIDTCARCGGRHLERTAARPGRRACQTRPVGGRRGFASCPVPRIDRAESTGPGRWFESIRNGQATFCRSFVYVSVTRNCRRSSWHRSFVCSP